MKRHFAPVPDALNPMLWLDDDKVYFDAVSAGWGVFYVFDENELDRSVDTCFYTVDPTGCGDFDTKVWTVPARHCPRCHQRMTVSDTRMADLKNLDYFCANCSE